MYSIRVLLLGPIVLVFLYTMQVINTSRGPHSANIQFTIVHAMHTQSCGAVVVGKCCGVVNEQMWCDKTVAAD